MNELAIAFASCALASLGAALLPTGRAARAAGALAALTALLSAAGFGLGAHRWEGTVRRAVWIAQETSGIALDRSLDAGVLGLCLAVASGALSIRDLPRDSWIARRLGAGATLCLLAAAWLAHVAAASR